MILGGAWGAWPDGGDDPALSLSIASPVDIIAENPTAQRIFLLIADPYDPVTEAEIPQYLSTAPFISGPEDSPPSEQFWSRLTNPLNWQASLYQEGQPISGTSVPAAGAKVIGNSDGALDAWTGYDWAGRRLRTYLTLPGRTLKQSAQVAESVAAGLEWDLDRIVVPIRDYRYSLEGSINEATYAGTGGLEGDDTLAGRSKPTVWGRFAQFEPVLVEAASHTYQVHVRSFEALTDLQDRGLNDFIFDGNVADITTVTPAAGHYATSLATGYLKLGEKPDGKLTCSGKGDNAGPLGYREDAAGILRKIVTQQLGFDDAADLDTGSFDDASADVPAPVYFTTRLDSVDGLTAAGEIGGPILYVTFTRLGRLAVGRVPSDFATRTPKATLTQADLREPSAGGTFSGRIAGLPPKEVRLGYARYETVLSPDEIAGAVSEAVRQDLGEQFRFKTDGTAGVVDRVPEARVLEIVSRLAVAANADSELARILLLLFPGRQTYDVQLERGLFQYFLGDILELVHPRFGLSGGRNMVALGVTENIGEYAAADSLKLLLWG
jgi:hypothetical protein